MTARLPPARLTPAEEASFREAYAAAQARSLMLGTKSRAQFFAELSADARAVILSQLSVLDRARLFWSWQWWGRPRQFVPRIDHRIWLLLAGRGFGKSRSMAERVRERIYRGSQLGALVGPTLKDIHRYMIGGAYAKAGKGSGILDVFPKNQRPEYRQMKGEVEFHTGAIYYIVTAETPEWRGGNVDTVWCDEPMKWGANEREALWDNMELSLRSDCGLPVEVLVSATPTPHPWLRKLIADPACVTTIGITDENAVNLEASFVARLEQRFGNSRKGRQERMAEILVDVEGALFSQSVIEASRCVQPPEFSRTVVAIDAALSIRKGADATGIVGASRGADDDFYPRMAWAGVVKPEEWARRAFDMAEALGTRRLVVERFRAADALTAVLRLVARERERETGRVIPWEYIEVSASESKKARADEVATMHEQGRVHFPAMERGADGAAVSPVAALEDEITTWDPNVGGPSPNLLDAMVWAAHDLYDGFGSGGGCPLCGGAVHCMACHASPCRCQAWGAPAAAPAPAGPVAPVAVSGAQPIGTWTPGRARRGLL